MEKKTTQKVVTLKDNVFVTSNMADKVLKCTLNECGFKCEGSTVPIPTPLCEHHYCVTYKKLHMDRR